MPIRCRFPATQRPRGPGFQTGRIADFQVGCTAHRLAGLEAPKPVPCGMNCSLCRAFLRRRNKCPGCRGDDRGKCKTRVACKIKNCEARRGSFCTYCASFPCERLIPRDAAQLTVAGFRPRPMGGDPAAKLGTSARLLLRVATPEWRMGPHDCGAPADRLPASATAGRS